MHRLVELVTEIPQENEFSVTAELKTLLQLCVGGPAGFLCGISLDFVIDFS